MAVDYTKADFDANYSIGAEGEWGRPAGTTEVRVHYIREAIAPLLAARWALIVPYLGLTDPEVIVVVGAAFGWGVEALEALLPGSDIVGTDISAYVQSVQSDDEDAEIDQNILDAGLALDDERAIRIANKWKSGQARKTVVVLDEDLSNPGSWNRVRGQLNNQEPSWIFIEDIEADLPDAEISDLATDLNRAPGTKVWLTSTERTRTLTELATLTGHRCLLINSAGIHGDVG